MRTKLLIEELEPISTCCTALALAPKRMNPRTLTFEPNIVCARMLAVWVPPVPPTLTEERTEMVLPHLTKPRILILDANSIFSSTDIELPKRSMERTLILDAISTWSKSDILPLLFKHDATLNPLPRRLYPRRESDDPCVMYSVIEHLAPRRAKLFNENELPTCT
jgi:hypothetical protein